MTELISRMSDTITLRMTLGFFIRITVACLCGGVIGVERSKRFKEAGIRTHCLVACVAAVFMIISKYCFADLTLDASGALFPGNRGADPARIAAQVVSGISFLGAGVIFKNGNSIKGLTTAAGLWLTAAIGMAIGSGLYMVGIFTTIILVTIQLLTHKFSVVDDTFSTSKITVVVKNTDNFYDWLVNQFDTRMQITSCNIIRNDNNTVTYSLTIQTNKRNETSQLITTLAHKENILSLSVAASE